MGKYHPNVDEYIVSRVRALESLLLEKGYISEDTVDKIVARYENDTGPMAGARAVARAWTNPRYKQLLLEDPTTALAQVGCDFDLLQVVENTDEVHNVIVCTLCSCYPWPVMGLPPTWYKSPPYRSRTVIEPRAVLAEFGTTLPEEIAIRIWDSSSEMRFMVLPQRPPGSDGLSEDELVPLITRDHLIGVQLVPAPSDTTADAGAPVS